MSAHPIPVLLYEIIQDLRALNPDRAPLIGVAGAQGSGKSYQCRLLTMANRPRFAHFSLDDVYHTRAEREDMARDVSKIEKERSPAFPDAAALEAALSTRGPPGTHDLALARGLIARLRQGSATKLPRFDKAQDDRAPESAWPLFTGNPEAIVIDGWCIGAETFDPPPTDDIVLSYERVRTAGALAGPYAAFFESFDAIVYLQAPNWEIVRQWRGQQEEQLRGRPLTGDENAWLDDFLTHYEDVTRSMMAGRHTANWVVRLDEARKVTRIEEM